MHCVVSVLFQLCRLDNGSGKRKINSHPFTFKLLSISIGVNSHVLNSPQTFQNHLTNSKNILLAYEVVVKRHAASRKRKCSLAEKLVSVCCGKTSQTSCQKHHAHPGKRSCTKNVSNSLANAKHAASVFPKQTLKLSINVGSKNLCSIMQSVENVQKHINPRCYSTILHQIQSCAQRRHCCHQIPVAIPSHAET